MSTNSVFPAGPALPAAVPAVVPAGPAVTSRLTPIDPIRLLKQYKLALIITVILGGILGVGLTFTLVRVAPKFTSAALLEVKGPLVDPLSVGGGLTMFRRDDLETFKATQAFFITSPEVFDQVLAREDVKKTNWYNRYDSHEQRLREFKDIVSVSPIRDAAVIRVAVTVDHPKEAQDLCAALVSQYLSIFERLNRDEESRVGTLFTRRRNELQDDIDRLLRQANERMTPNESTSVRQRLEETNAIMAGLIKEREEVGRMLQTAQFAYAAMTQAQAQGSLDYSASDYQQVGMDPMIRQIDARLMSLREELRVARQRFGDNHRSVREINNRIRAAEMEKEQKTQELLRQLKEAQINELEGQIGSMQSRMADLAKQFDQIRAQYIELDQRIRDYDTIQQELERKREELAHYEELLVSIEQMRQDPRANRVILRSPAERPLEPSFPKYKIMVPAVTFLCLMVVGGFIFLRELLDQRIKSPSCVGLLPHGDLLGVIPHASEDPSGLANVDLVVTRKPNCLVAETFRQLRTEVISRLNRRGFKTLMVVGSQPQGGVSSVAANLGASLAMNHRKVLLIDANFRRPSLHKTFGIDRQPGLGELLSGLAQVDQIVHATNIESLDVVPIGGSGAEVLERIESVAFSDMLAEMTRRYDLVLIDAAPMSVVGDSRLLANRVDAVMMVVRAMNEKRGMVSRMMRQLASTRAELIGLVLNGVRSSAGGYFRRNYRAYYEYQAQGRKTARKAAS